MAARFSLAVVLGSVATFLLFLLMQSLIAIGSPAKEDTITGTVVDFVRAREDSTTRTKERTPPKKVQNEQPPPPPDINTARANKPSNSSDLNAINVNLDVELAGGSGVGGAPTDGDIMPLVRIEPRYPSRALSRGIEGWVLVEFTISATGGISGEHRDEILRRVAEALDDKLEEIRQQLDSLVGTAV